jgi:hypothetical protein
MQAALDAELLDQARELQSKGVFINPERWRRVFREEAGEEDYTDEPRSPSPTSWRVHGKNRYPVWIRSSGTL